MNRFKFSATSAERLGTVSTYLELCARTFLADSFVDITVPPYGGKREIPEQKMLFDKGYSKCDGVKNTSLHQREDKQHKGLALDLVPYANGKADYSAQARFGYVGRGMLDTWEMLKQRGDVPQDLYLHWGGLWSNYGGAMGWDLAHYEIRSHAQTSKLK